MRTKKLWKRVLAAALSVTMLSGLPAEAFAIEETGTEVVEETEVTGETEQIEETEVTSETEKIEETETVWETEVVQETESVEETETVGETEVAGETENTEVEIAVDEKNTAAGFNYNRYKDANGNSSIEITGYTGSETQLVIPDEIDGTPVNRLGRYAFARCAGLTSVTLPQYLTCIGYAAFFQCTGLTEITIPSTVTSIEDWAFSSCENLKSITIPAGVTSIGISVFTSCSNLESMVVDSQNTIYTSENKNCIIEKESHTLIASCKNTVIPSDVKGIAEYAFGDYCDLTKIILPEGLTTIGEKAFIGCTGLTEITYPSTLTTIGDEAFSGCSSLTGITIPAKVTKIGKGVFVHCGNLSSITVQEGNDAYTSANSNCIIERSSNTIIAGCKNTVVPQGVECIGELTFSYCNDLTSFVLPEGVTTIEDKAFMYCENLTEITLPESLTMIGTEAFLNCKKLKDMNLPSTMKYIEDGAFWNCEQLTDITIPSGIKTIFEYTFNGCTGLTNVVIPSTVHFIEEEAFWGCTSLKSIMLPEGVERIADRAFSECKSLTGILIPPSVTYIGNGIFEDAGQVTIYCAADSYARQYAIDNKIPYKSIEEWDGLFCSHGNQELRNAASATCTEAGYTGDTYCKDCGELLNKGKSTAALGHSYKAVVTKQPTVDTEGVKTYTCSRCNAVYTEKIAKLTVSYTVKFDGNGADSGSMTNQKITYGSETSLSTNKFQRKGYTFKNWNTKKDGSGTAYADKADGSKLTKTDGAEITLYAQWTANKYTITFNGNGNTSGSTKKLSNCKYGKKCTLTKNGFKKTGYTFSGWNTKKDGSGKSYKNKAEVKNLTSKSGGKVTLYAQWKKTKYTITYNLNKGKNHKNNPASYNITTKTIRLKNPTRKGYTFKGWYSDKKCTKKVTQIKKGSTGNVTLYAKWKKK